MNSLDLSRDIARACGEAFGESSDPTPNATSTQLLKLPPEQAVIIFADRVLYIRVLDFVWHGAAGAGPIDKGQGGEDSQEEVHVILFSKSAESAGAVSYHAPAHREIYKASGTRLNPHKNSSAGGMDALVQPFMDTAQSSWALLASQRGVHPAVEARCVGAYTAVVRRNLQVFALR